MLYGLDLFSGIGGGAYALSGYVRPVAYCEIESYAQRVLLSNISRGTIPFAPIWDDVSTLKGNDVGSVDIIYGGFPCQDISVAGHGAGLEGKRSGLFYEILRLCDELTPPFLFLENVPAIRTRGAERVAKELARRGYDCRWHTLSAAQVGAPHKRDRWWLLAHSVRNNLWDESRRGCGEKREGKTFPEFDGSAKLVADTESPGRPEGRTVPRGHVTGCGWWTTEPNVGRVAHGVPFWMDRLRGLGNAWVPSQARQAFEELMGLR